MQRNAEDLRVEHDIKMGKVARQRELDRRAAVRKAQEAAAKRPTNIVV